MYIASLNNLTPVPVVYQVSVNSSRACSFITYDKYDKTQFKTEFYTKVNLSSG